MLRPAHPQDTPAILALAIACGMFQPEEVGPLQTVFDEMHAGQLGPGHQVQVWAPVGQDVPTGVVYFAPNTMTDRTWDLWMIAVAPQLQGQGVGSALIEFVEDCVHKAGGRLLLIETSSLAKYDAARGFYRKHGYKEVALIPDFYTDEDSKVIFTKRMQPKS